MSANNDILENDDTKYFIEQNEEETLEDKLKDLPNGSYVLRNKSKGYSFFINEKLENQRIVCDLELEDDSNCKVSFPLTWTYEDFLDEDNLKNIIIEKENGDL